MGVVKIVPHREMEHPARVRDLMNAMLSDKLDQGWQRCSTAKKQSKKTEVPAGIPMCSLVREG